MEERDAALLAWDGTWDESFVYVIYDAYGYQEARRGGEEQAREAGEKALNRLEERK